MGLRIQKKNPGITKVSVIFLKFFLSLFIYAERESEHEQRRGRKKEREIEREREKIPSRLHTVSSEPNMGLDLMNCGIMI